MAEQSALVQKALTVDKNEMSDQMTSIKQELNQEMSDLIASLEQRLTDDYTVALKQEMVFMSSKQEEFRAEFREQQKLKL